jgi:hypothetical protein
MEELSHVFNEESVYKSQIYWQIVISTQLAFLYIQPPWEQSQLELYNIQNQDGPQKYLNQLSS